MKTIGYVSVQNPFEDKRAWSGSIYKIREGIENAGYRVIWVPVRNNTIKHKLIKCVIKLFFGKDAITNHNEYFLKTSANLIDENIVDKCDYLFFPGGAQLSVYRNWKKPIIYYTDVNFCLMIDYYWYNQSKWIVNQGNKVERLAIQNSYINIRSSKWAADSVVKDYDGNPNKNYVIEFGPNLDDKDIFHVEPYREGVLNILFSGVEWYRKGASIAIDVVKSLNRRGIKSRLFLVGINKDVIPNEYLNLPYVEYIGFLNKNFQDQYDEYIDIIKKSHIFLLPTRAECAGIVFAESSAYGLPIYTYNTGGIGNYVIDGVNGYKLPLNSGSEDFADEIERSLRKGDFKRLSQGGIRLYKEKLNWYAWASSFKKIMQENDL